MRVASFTPMKLALIGRILIKRSNKTTSLAPGAWTPSTQPLLLRSLNVLIELLIIIHSEF